MDSATLLRIATRIHYALLRHLGVGIDVGSMLSRKSYMREVLFVCQGSGDAELKTLGEQFAQARAAGRAQRPMPSVPKAKGPLADPRNIPELPTTAVVADPSTWAHSASDFGMTRPPGLNVSAADVAGEAPIKGKRWFDPGRWLRRDPT